MCRYGTRPFSAEVTETRAARRWVVSMLRRWELGALAEGLELAASELVTNALLHTRSGFDVMLAACSGTVELAVRDRDPREPVLRPARLDLLSDLDVLAAAGQPDPPPPADSRDPGAVERHPSLHIGPAGSIAAGRGLLIVDAIADEWGVASHAQGKDVWLHVPVPDGWTHAAGCTCTAPDQHTAAGRPVRHQHGPWDDENPGPAEPTD